jgi:hypothetical protein
MGRNAEVRFMRISERHGYKYRAANRRENMVEHFDFILNGRLKVEVKAMKAKRRGESVTPDIVYVETKNVNGGAGWVYGKADFIAFEQPDGFLFVDRNELVAYLHKKLPHMRRAIYSGVFNTIYSRNGRDDEVAIFNIRDIFTIPNNFFLHGL